MNAALSKLDRLIANTRAIERGLRADLAQALADIPVRAQIEQALARVQKRLASMNNLRALPPAQAAAMAAAAGEYRPRPRRSTVCGPGYSRARPRGLRNDTGSGVSITTSPLRQLGRCGSQSRQRPRPHAADGAQARDGLTLGMSKCSSG